MLSGKLPPLSVLLLRSSDIGAQVLRADPSLCIMFQFFDGFALQRNSLSQFSSLLLDEIVSALALGRLALLFQLVIGEGTHTDDHLVEARFNVLAASIFPRRLKACAIDAVKVQRQFAGWFVGICRRVNIPTASVSRRFLGGQLIRDPPHALIEYGLKWNAIHHYSCMPKPSITCLAMLYGETAVPACLGQGIYYGDCTIF